MRIRPILFNTDMVRAILDGRKTATRRALKYPFEVHPNGFITKPRGHDRLCPYEPPYQQGDILYIRETWSIKRSSKCVGNKTEKCPYESCENAPGPCLYDEYIYKATDNLESSDITWHPSIHMPKEAARIWLKVLDVRVERLQNITEEQAKSEGAIDNRGFIQSSENEYNVIHSAREHFMSIWDSTISKGQQDLYSWEVNPWVWVIEFERCEKPEATDNTI